MAFVDFDELKISTQTIIADTGIPMDIEDIFARVSVDNDKGSASVGQDWMSLVDTVRIMAMYHKEQTVVSEQYEFKKRSRFFRNALNVILCIGGTKMINFKLSKNGKFQLTGCKDAGHAKASVVAFLRRVHAVCGCLPPTTTVVIQTVMTNVDFNTGHAINRTILDDNMNRLTPFFSLLETSFGYTGVNIKIPVPQDYWRTLDVPVIIIEEGSRIREETRVLGDVLQAQDRQKVMIKPKYNTFLVFHSGNIIMSGMCPQVMRGDYKILTGLLTEWRGQITEKMLE